MRPTVYSPYPRRLERLTICRSQSNKRTHQPAQSSNRKMKQRKRKEMTHILTVSLKTCALSEILRNCSCLEASVISGNCLVAMFLRNLVKRFNIINPLARPRKPLTLSPVIPSDLRSFSLSIEMRLRYNVDLRTEECLFNSHICGISLGFPRSRTMIKYTPKLDQEYCSDLEYKDDSIRKTKRIILIAAESRKTYHRPLHFEKSKSMWKQITK